MPSNPPESTFYQNPANYQAWRDISRLWENFAGENETQRSQLKADFRTILHDIDSQFEESVERAVGQYPNL